MNGITTAKQAFEWLKEKLISGPKNTADLKTQWIAETKGSVTTLYRAIRNLNCYYDYKGMISLLPFRQQKTTTIKKLKSRRHIRTTAKTWLKEELKDGTPKTKKELISLWNSIGGSYSTLYRAATDLKCVTGRLLKCSSWQLPTNESNKNNTQEPFINNKNSNKEQKPSIQSLPFFDDVWQTKDNIHFTLDVPGGQLFETRDKDGNAINCVFFREKKG